MTLKTSFLVVNTIIKEVLRNENRDKIINIVEKIFNFNKQQKGKGFKILTLKQMLERLPIAFAQVKAGNTSEDLLMEIFQIIYYLHQAKEITKNVYDNILYL